jgi:predicted membrane-bound spermidine synthase
MSNVTAFVGGLIAMAFAVSGLFFLRFWRSTRDALFAIFAIAFWLLALNQTLLALSGVVREERSWIFLIRLAAFVLIIVGVVGKNLGRRSDR